LCFTPVVGSFADAANGVIHVARGNYVEAGFSFVAVIGDAVAAERKAVKAADKVGDIINSGRKADEALDLAKGITNNRVVSNETVEIAKQKPGTYRPSNPLPQDKNGNKIPSSQSPHTQIGTKEGRNGSYTQAREFGENGQLIKDIDFTDHGRPAMHPNPHQHPWIPNSTGGTMQRGKSEPFDF
jgi:hypothetical protein